jgi:hypothetical protein
MSKLAGNIVLGLLATGLGAGLWLQSSANQSLREEQARLLLQAAELVRFQNLRAQKDAATTSPSDQEKLQSEIDEENQLRSRIVELKETQARLTATNTTPVVKKRSEAVWRNAGQASPTDTVHSVIWAAMNGEVETLMPMLAFDPESRIAAEALRNGLPAATQALYPTVEQLIATMIAGRMAPDFVQADAIEQTNEDANRISAKVQLQRSGKAAKSREVTFCFQRNGADWQLLVPKSVIDDFQQSLKRR